MIIGITGAPSTGKTTLANELSEEYMLPIVPELAREYLEEHGKIETAEEQYLISVKQKELEEVCRYSLDNVLVETPSFVGRVYSHIYFPEKENELYRTFRDEHLRYDVIFHCLPLGFIEDDNVRYVISEGAQQNLSQKLYAMARKYSSNVILLPSMEIKDRLEYANFNIDKLIYDEINSKEQL